MNKYVVEFIGTFFLVFTIGNVVIAPGEVRYETYRAPGPGGQHRNTSDTAVRVTHLPTGVQASLPAARAARRPAGAGR